MRKRDDDWEAAGALVCTRACIRRWPYDGIAAFCAGPLHMADACSSGKE